VAEHRVAEFRRVITLSRTTPRIRAIALACITALGFAAVPSAATAQGGASIAATRAEIDATAGQWFAAQRQVAALDLKIETLTQTLAPTERRVATLGQSADERAVQLYESNTQGLSSVVGGDVMTSDPLEVGRRAALIGQANADDRVVMDELEAAIADLSARRDQLRAVRATQAQNLQYLTARREALDAQLASLSGQAAHAADHSRLTASVHTDSTPPPTAAPTGSDPASVSASVSPPTEIATVPVAVTAPTRSAVSPHHNEPFLVCTRARESSGNYAAVSASGMYYGAYQFLPTTWNVTAAHAGRLDLVGVTPSAAAPYDQDELAWALYLWQGSAPWGGRC
jgi:peptidoglycan hydrolase CwlO-like protein